MPSSVDEVSDDLLFLLALYAYIFHTALRSLEHNGLVRVAWIEGGESEDSRLTDKGLSYISENPSLLNPVDWKWIITTVLAAIGAIAGILALFICCSRF